MEPVAIVVTIGWRRPTMTINPLTAPHRQPTSSTANAPTAVPHEDPTTMTDARQLASTITMPTDRSMPDVNTTSVWAIATIASSTPLFAAVVATLTVRPAGWLPA